MRNSFGFLHLPSQLFGFDAKLDERSVADLRLQNTEGSAGGEASALNKIV